MRIPKGLNVTPKEMKCRLVHVGLNTIKNPKDMRIFYKEMHSRGLLYGKDAGEHALEINERLILEGKRNRIDVKG